MQKTFPSFHPKNSYDKNVIFQNGLILTPDNPVVFHGNVLVNGNLTILLDKHSTPDFRGYLFVTGYINILSNCNVSFERTVYVKRNIFIAGGDHSNIRFEQGFVSGSAISLISKKGELTINNEQKAPAPGGTVVNTTTSGINYK